jgi:hypothetical protein
MNLCTGCRVQPSTTVVGAYPVCGICCGKVTDIVGKQYGYEIVGQSTAPGTLWWQNPVVILGGMGLLGLVAFMAFMEYENTEPVKKLDDWKYHRGDWEGYIKSRQYKDRGMAHRMMSQR